MKERIEDAIRQSIRAKEALLAEAPDVIERAAASMIESLRAGGKILVFGNGGSAADSQHMAAELVGRYKMERGALAAIALTTNTSTLTAVGNDYGYEAVFSRQVEALGRAGDVAVGISTSGNSANVIEAVKKAKSMGLKTVCIVGGDGGRLKAAADIAIIVRSKDTPRVQESHITVIHILCELIEENICR